ncbi:hypothetical protein ANAEL_05722 [Anaerolineales bacterium]|nr:hypothetical protein ANAEL_05722 [Anaerolineales bacterium]
MTRFPEVESELKRKRIKAEMDAIRLEEEAIRGKTLLDKSLALLGKWMIANGEKLRKQHHPSQESSAAKLANKVA